MADTPDHVSKKPPEPINAKPATKRKGEPNPGSLPPDRPKLVKVPPPKFKPFPPQMVPIDPDSDDDSDANWRWATPEELSRPNPPDDDGPTAVQDSTTGCQPPDGGPVAGKPHG